MRELAPAKININLLIGPLRDDGRHELASVMQSITICDRLEISDAERDEVICPGVEGPNLAATALAAFREATGWEGPPQRIEIGKRIPVAAGMAGGSADAAAALRLLTRRSGLGSAELLHELATALGSDVASQIRPGRSLVRGGGEKVRRLGAPSPFGVLVLPSGAALSTAAVYAEADRLGLPRSAEELAAIDPLSAGAINDLEPAARSLEPTIDAALERVRSAGARDALVCGSGPTVIGLFAHYEEAAAAAARLGGAAIAALALIGWPSIL